MSEEIQLQESSGNIFADLGFSQPEEMLFKAELVRLISQIISQRHLSQSEAAELLEIDQPQQSALMRGKLTRFSTEQLFRFLNILGRDVEIIVKPKPKSQPTGQTKVVI